MHDVEQTEQTVRQVESIYEMTTPDALDLSSPLPAEAPATSPRNRTRA